MKLDILRKDFYYNGKDFLCPLGTAVKRHTGVKNVVVHSPTIPVIYLDDKPTYVYDGTSWNGHVHYLLTYNFFGKVDDTVMLTLTLEPYSEEAKERLALGIT